MFKKWLFLVVKNSWKVNLKTLLVYYIQSRFFLLPVKRVGNNLPVYVRGNTWHVTALWSAMMPWGVPKPVESEVKTSFPQREAVSAVFVLHSMEKYNPVLIKLSIDVATDIQFLESRNPFYLILIKFKGGISNNSEKTFLFLNNTSTVVLERCTTNVCIFLKRKSQCWNNYVKTK